MKPIKKICSLVLIIILLLELGCAAIPANKIKIEEYPEINKNQSKELLLSYETFKFTPDKKGYIFDDLILSKLSENLKSEGKSSCSAKISTMHSAPFPRLCIANYFLAGFTLFTIPYYCQHIYEAKASLISYPSPESIKGKSFNILANQSQAKAGDYFLDENSRLAHLLKTYELKDKVHEVWSLLWFLSWFAVNPTKYAPNTDYPEEAKKITENNISESLTRSILNDASNFKECRK